MRKVTLNDALEAPEMDALDLIQEETIKREEILTELNSPDLDKDRSIELRRQLAMLKHSYQEKRRQALLVSYSRQ